MTSAMKMISLVINTMIREMQQQTNCDIESMTNEADGFPFIQAVITAELGEKRHCVPLFLSVTACHGGEMNPSYQTMSKIERWCQIWQTPPLTVPWLTFRCEKPLFPLYNK